MNFRELGKEAAENSVAFAQSPHQLPPEATHGPMDLHNSALSNPTRSWNPLLGDRYSGVGRGPVSSALDNFGQSTAQRSSPFGHDPMFPVANNPLLQASLAANPSAIQLGATAAANIAPLVYRGAVKPIAKYMLADTALRAAGVQQHMDRFANDKFRVPGQNPLRDIEHMPSKWNYLPNMATKAVLPLLLSGGASPAVSAWNGASALGKNPIPSTIKSVLSGNFLRNTALESGVVGAGAGLDIGLNGENALSKIRPE